MDIEKVRDMQRVWYTYGQPLVNNMISPLMKYLQDLDIYKLSDVKEELLNLKENIYEKFKEIFDRLNTLEKEIQKMPLVKGKKASTPKGFSENVKHEKKEGKKTDQAVAIAYSEADRGKKKKVLKKKRAK